MASQVGHYSSSYSDADVLQILWQWDARRLSAGQIAISMGASRNAVLGLLHRMRRQAVEPDRFSDGALLAMVGRVDAGIPADAVAKDFAISRNAVLGIVHAVRLDLARAGACACERAENRNGGMPAQWWRDGLARQVAA